MAGRIRDADIVRVREVAALADVVAESGVALRPAGGGRLKGLCPFHEEKSPSFSVNPALGFFHCLAGETGVLTDEGVVPIRELAGRTVRVLTSGRGAATWVDAPFFSFGEQPLMKITLSRNGRVKHLFATDEHRWFVRCGGQRQSRKERFTKDLKAGDRLSSAFPPSRISHPASRPSPFAATGEFTLGGGTVKHGALALIDAPRERFLAHPNAYDRRGWVVRSVEATDRVEEVFCAVVPDTHNFTLEGNLLTGNCFGCGESGDVITFLRNSEHLSFVEAVEHLAQRYNIELTYEQGGSAAGRQSSQRSRLIDAHRLAAQFFVEQLATPEAALGREFLAERGFDQAAAQTYGVGYAPVGWDVLVKYLRDKGFTAEELLASGLVSQGQRGPMDRFRGRLLWPIRDISGEVVGFGARKLREDDQGPKYLNSPETPIYKKSTVLYGLDVAKKEIARRRQAVVVEGYTDVMACHLAGVPTAVATCGTAFGSDHIGVLRRLLMDQDEFRGEVIFTFDGDAAGQKAALKAFGDDQRFVAQTYIAISPDGMDPCELRLNRGDAAVCDVVAARVPLVEFAVRSVLARHDLESVEGRVQALQTSAPLIARIKDRSLRPEYARRLAGWLGMEVEPVMSRVGELAGEEGSPVRRTATVGGADAATLAVEREAIKLAVQDPVLVTPLFDALDDEVFTSPELRQVHEVVRKIGGTTGAVSGESWVTKLHEACPDDAVRSLVTELAVESLKSDSAPDDRYAGAVLARLQEHAVTRRVAQVKPALQRVNPVEEPERYARLFAELVALEQTARSLRERGIGTL